VSFAAVTADPSANQVHAMAENTPVTMCGLEAADCYVVHEDFQAANAGMRCPHCDEAIAIAIAASDRAAGPSAKARLPGRSDSPLA
jgi:hypothetical protein